MNTMAKGTKTTKTTMIRERNITAQSLQPIIQAVYNPDGNFAVAGMLMFKVR
jgi:hypothetical protein